MEVTTNLNDAAAVVALLDEAAETMQTVACRSESVVRLPARGRLVATGDLHDNPFHLDKVIRVARLDASADHHVVLHEMIHGDRLLNGMDFSYRMLARVAELVLRYPGQVHPVLANHELAQMTGRGVSKGAGNNVELFRDALSFVFGDDAGDVEAALGRWMRAMPLALLSEAGVCCAHSLPNEAMMKHFDPAIVERPLADADYVGPRGAAYLMTWGRGYTEDTIAALAEAWDVRLFCLGHQHVETGIETMGEHVVILNSDHERATVVPLDLADIPSASEALMHAIPLSALG